MRRRGLAINAGLAAALACVGAGTSASASNSHYYYDAQGRLIGITTDSSQLSSYSYDSADNRANASKLYPAPPESSQAMGQYNYLFREQVLVSADGRFALTLQTDGNLVLYGPSGALWSTNTSLSFGSSLSMNPDGNLVLYDPQFKPLWASNTTNSPGANLVVQNDGNVVIYDRNSNAVWSTGTCCH